MKIPKKPTRKPSTYDYRYLELARGIEQAGAGVILNPRDIGSTSLFLADLDFRNDLKLHYDWVQYERDRIEANKPHHGRG